MTPRSNSTEKDQKPDHRITTTHSAFGYGWYCACGARGRGDMAPTERAAYGYGERHVRHALRANPPAEEQA